MKPRLLGSRILPHIVIGAFLVAAVWAATQHIVSAERDQKLARAARDAKNLASFFEEHTLQTIRYSDSYLKTARREFVENGSVDAVRELLEEVPLDHSIVSHITIIDEAGTPILVSGHAIKPGTTAKDRDYFRFQRDSGGDQIFVSLPKRGRNTGKLLVRLVRRINLPDGRFGGVIFAALEVEQITRFFSALNLGPNSSATLVGTDKKIRARSSYGRLGPGQDISGSRIWQELEQSPVGLYKQTSVVDGITRFYAYRKLLEYPLIVAIGVSTDDLSRAFTRFELPIYAIAILVTIVITVMTTLVCREISIRRRLQVGEARLRSIMDNLPAEISLKDMEGRYIQVNRQFTKWFGYTNEDIRGKTPREIWPDEIRNTILSNDRAVRETGRVIEHEERFVFEDGEHTLLDCKFPILDEAGNMIGTAAIATDITERKRTEEELREAQERFRILVEHAPEAVVLFDAGEDRIVEANENAAILFGLRREKLLEMGPMDLSPEVQPGGESSRQLAQKMTHKAMAGEVPVYEWTHCDAEGRLITCEVRLVRLVLGGRTLLRASIIDITERKELEEQLRQTQKMKAVGQLTGGVAHDFNNLLAIIQGNLEIAQEKCESGSELEQLIGPALRAAGRGADLTSRLLSFSRKQKLQPRLLDLGKAVSGMTEILRRALGAMIDVEVIIAEDLWPCRADPGLLENALLNLAINARDAMPNGGKLRIECANARLVADPSSRIGDADAQDCVVLRVTDKGVGMSAEVKERALEPFFTTKDVGQGSGLGLSMVYGFALQSGGRVAIDSEEGQGTTVKLYLPRSVEEMTTEPQEEREVVSAGHGEAILVVEDEADLRRLTTKILGDLGYEVFEARDAEGALMQLDKGMELLLTDIVLPGGMNGLDLAQEARRRSPGIKVVLMSGYSDDTMASSEPTEERHEILRKPFRKRELARWVRAALDGQAEPEIRKRAV